MERLTISVFQFTADVASERTLLGSRTLHGRQFAYWQFPGFHIQGPP